MSNLGRITMIQEDTDTHITLEIESITPTRGIFEFVAKHTIYPGQPDLTVPAGIYQATIYGTDGSLCFRSVTTLGATQTASPDERGAATFTLNLPVRMI